jgi:hypothetical protein
MARDVVKPISRTKSHGKRFQTIKKTNAWNLMGKNILQLKVSHHNVAL